MSVYALSVAGATSEQAKWLAEHENKELDKKSSNQDEHVVSITKQCIVSSLDGSKVLANGNGLAVHAPKLNKLGLRAQGL